MKEERKQYWQKVMQRQSTSGLSKKAFCEQQGIKAPTFYYWQHQLEEIKSPPEEGFYRIKPKQNTEIVVCLPDNRQMNHR